MDATPLFTTAEEITQRIAALEAIDWEAYLFDQVGEHDASDLFTDRDPYPGPKGSTQARVGRSTHPGEGASPGPRVLSFQRHPRGGSPALFVTLTELIVTPSVTLNVTLPGQDVVVEPRPSLMLGPRRRPPRSPPLAPMSPAQLPAPGLSLPLPAPSPATRPSPASDRDARRLLLLEQVGHFHVSVPAWPSRALWPAYGAIPGQR